MNRPALFFAALVACALAVALFSFPYAPLEDLPEWIYQGYAFNRLAAGDVSPLFELKSYPVPYALLQLVVSAVLTAFDPMTGSRVIVALYAATALVAVHRVVVENELPPWVGWPLLVSAVVLNAPFWNGYMGYQSGLIVLLLFLGTPRARRSDPVWVLAFSLLAFFAHGWGFVALLAFVGAYALYDRRVFGCGLALLPALGLLGWYQAKNVAHQPMAVLFDFNQANPGLYKAYTLLKAAPYHNAIAFDFNAAAHFGLGYLGLGLACDALFLGATLLLAAQAFRALGWTTIARRPEFLAGVALVTLALAMPPTGFQMANPGERLMLPGLVALILAFFSRAPLASLASQRALTGALIGGLALFGVGLTAAGAAYQRSSALGIDSASAAMVSPQTWTKWFGHRVVQFDSKMKHVETAWRAGVMPTLPLDFETGLLAVKPR